MKRRYSPAARKAHLRAMHLKPMVQEVEQTNPIRKLIESYQQGFLTALELADLILETLPLPKPEPAPKPPTANCYRCNKPALPGFRRWDDFRSGWQCGACAALPKPEPEQPIDCDCSACVAKQQPALQGRCIGCGALTPDSIPVDADGLFGEDWCCKTCQGEPWAKPIEGRYSFDSEGGAA